MKRFIVLLLWCSLFQVAYAAAQDVYTFKNETQHEQFNRLTMQLRCLVCQNESLADSNAPLAQDLRAEVASMVNQGASDEQIKNYLVQRYGDFILFKPPFAASTYLLWLAPFVFILIGSLTLVILVKRRRYLKRK